MIPLNPIIINDDSAFDDLVPMPIMCDSLASMNLVPIGIMERHVLSEDTIPYLETNYQTENLLEPILASEFTPSLMKIKHFRMRVAPVATRVSLNRPRGRKKKTQDKHIVLPFNLVK